MYMELIMLWKSGLRRRSHLRTSTVGSFRKIAKSDYFLIYLLIYLRSYFFTYLLIYLPNYLLTYLITYLFTYLFT